MKKDYKNWHNLKNNINNINKEIFFREREVWFCYFGANIGFEQDGKGEKFLRPVLILKKFNKNILLCIPFSKSIKINKFYFKINFNNIDQSIILSQIKVIDYRRLREKIGIINSNLFIDIKKTLSDLIF